jgi:putative ABC transport system permease protein
MLTWLKIALRNLLKQKRRSCFTMGAIALGFAAVNVFGAFMQYIFTSLGDSYIYGQGNGHISIFRKGYREEGQDNRPAFLLSSNDLATINAVLGRDPRVVATSPMLVMQGLISNGRKSTIFVASGTSLTQSQRIRESRQGIWNRMHIGEGTKISDERPGDIGMGNLLMRRLGLKFGDDVILSGATVEGQMNAIDARVCASFEAGGEQVNDKAVFGSINLLRQLYDTDGADQLNVLLTDGRLTDRLRVEFETTLAAAGVPVEIGTWYNLCPMYTKTVAMFNVIFKFLFTIVLVIVVLTVVNTISMAVMERTREIGTLRSLGLRRRGVVVLFAAESLLLAFLGSLAGLALTLLAWLGVHLGQPMWYPPTISVGIPIELHLVPRYMLVTLALLMALAVLAAFFPSRRAARMNVVDALGHV